MKDFLLALVLLFLTATATAQVGPEYRPPVGPLTPVPVAANIGHCLTNNGTVPAWCNNSPIDASQWAGVSGTYGTCTLGTNDNICLANAVNSIVGTPGSTGGYATIDASGLGVSGAEIWLKNPFDNLISLFDGSTQVTAPLKCGTLILSSGHLITVSAPIWVPRCWDIRWTTSYSQGGRGIIASGSWPATIAGTATNTGCNQTACSTGGGTLVSTGQYQFVVTASAPWATTPVRGQMFAVCTATGASGPSCSGPTAGFTNGSAVITATNNFAAGEPVQFLTTGTLPTNFATQTNYYVIITGLSTSQFEVATSPGGSAVSAGSAGSGTQTVNSPTTCGTLCGAVAWGIVLVVTDTTHITVGSNNFAHAGPNASNVNFVIFGDMVSLGTVSQTGSDAGGSSATIVGGAYSCNDNANVAYALSNYSVQEKSYWNNVQIQHCIMHVMTVQGSGAVNSGPYDEMVINMDASCTHVTVPIVLRVSGSMKEVSRFTINQDQTNCADVAIDDEAGGDLFKWHAEDTSTNSSPNSAVLIGQNTGAVPAVICTVMCVEPTNNGIGAVVTGEDLAGTYTNGVFIGSAYSAASSVLITNMKGNAALTNTINDTAIPCVIAATNGDNYVQLYSRNGNNGRVIASGYSGTSTCPTIETRVYSTQSATGSATLGPTTMLTVAAAGTSFYRFSPYVYQVGIGSGGTCGTASTVAVSVTFTDPAGAAQALTVATFTTGTAAGVANTPEAISSGIGTYQFQAKTATAVRFTATVTAGNCTNQPTFFIIPFLSQL